MAHGRDEEGKQVPAVPPDPGPARRKDKGTWLSILESILKIWGNKSGKLDKER